MLAPDVAQDLELIKHGSSLSTGLLSHFVYLISGVLGILRCRLEPLLEAIYLQHMSQAPELVDLTKLTFSCSD